MIIEGNNPDENCFKLQVPGRISGRSDEENSRIDEIARMLGGKISEQSRAHAIELLSAASQDFASLDFANQDLLGLT